MDHGIINHRWPGYPQDPDGVRHDFVRGPEYRALDEIVADAESAGVPVVAIGPAGILEIQPPWPVNVVPCRIRVFPRLPPTTNHPYERTENE